MQKCPECKLLYTLQCMGDGSCDKHGRFAYYEHGLKENCYKCAIEQNICQRCGKKMPAESKS